MIDEASRRKEEFALEHSAPVVLADGQTWYLPKPWIAIVPQFENGKLVTSYNVLTCGRELDRLIAAVSESTGSDAIVGVLLLAGFLLRRNYELTDEEISGLITYRLGDPESEAMVEAILNTATGRDAPKVSSGGRV